MKLSKKYEKICNEYLVLFCEKHEMEFESWVANRVGELAVINDFYFDFNQIREDIDNDYPKHLIIDWYYHNCSNNQYINLSTWAKANKDIKTGVNRNKMPFPNKDKTFKKGQSGNPNGRPKGSLRDIKEVLRDLLSQDKNNVQLIDGLMTVVVNKALKGDLKAVDMLLSYTYGKPTQKTEITGAEGEPIEIKHDLSKLSANELKQLKEIATKLEGDK